MVRQNCVGIRPHSEISVRLCPLCHGGSSDHLLNGAIGAELEKANSKGCPKLMIADRCAVTAARTRVIFLNICIDKSTGLIFHSKTLSQSCIITFVEPGSRSLSIILKVVFWGGTEPWRLDTNMRYFTYVKEGSLSSFLIQEFKTNQN